MAPIQPCSYVWLQRYAEQCVCKLKGLKLIKCKTVCVLGGFRLLRWGKLIVDSRSLRNFQIHPSDNKSQTLAMNLQCHYSNKKRYCSDCVHLINHAKVLNNAKCLCGDYHYGKQYKTGQLECFIPFLCHSHFILASECVFFFHNLILLSLKLEISSPHISAHRIYIIRYLHELAKFDAFQVLQSLMGPWGERLACQVA